MPADLYSPAGVAGVRSAKCQGTLWRLMWEIRTINFRLDKLRQFRANALGVTGPQWLILMALMELDKESGVPMHVVAKFINVDPSFVTTQSKVLEKQGLLRRKPSTSDARIIEMSLTHKTYDHLASMTAQEEALDQFVFGDLANQELTDFAKRLTALKHRLEKAQLRAALEF